MSQIGVSYTPSVGSVVSIVLDNFGSNEMPRTYQAATSLSLSANGASVLTGPSFRQKYQWVISSILETADAYQVDLLFQSWDYDRALGLPAACGITDETWGPSISTNAIFVTPPSFVRLSPALTLASFGLEEV
jgi:hypothetical protein